MLLLRLLLNAPADVIQKLRLPVRKAENRLMLIIVWCRDELEWGNFSIIGNCVGCSKHVVVLEYGYFPVVEAESSTTNACRRLRKNSISFYWSWCTSSRAMLLWGQTAEKPETCGEARNLWRSQKPAESRVEVQITENEEWRDRAWEPEPSVVVVPKLKERTSVFSA